MKIRLSTDDEWEIVACRDSGALRKFPWGDEFDAGVANLAGEGPGAAGSFPKDRSACGAMDMAGNVCEWVKTASGGYAARGGCFDDGGSPVSARCAFRTEMSGREKSQRIGFRVAVELK
jgi:formylglycine-generating enzyme required for sulfatase activity